MNESTFMEKEHEAGFHTSEDWAVLKDRCPECFKLSKKYSITKFIGGDWRNELGTSIAKGRFIDDPQFITNPLG